MKRLLLTLAVLALVTATTADAADRWGRSSYGTRYGGSYNANGYRNGANLNGYNSRGGFNSYGSSSYGTRTFVFPQENTMILQQDLGYGTSVFSSSPIQQYGSSAPVYTPYQRAANKPAWMR